MRYSYYGKNIELIIDEIGDPEENNEAISRGIANYLKKTYLTWNRDSVDDALIKRHLKDLSHNNLQVSDEEMLTSTYELLGKPKRKPIQKKKTSNRKK